MTFEARLPPRDPPVAPTRLDPTGRTGPTRGAARGGQWRRVGPGLYLPSATVDSPEQRIANAAAWQPAGLVSGWAALRLAGVSYAEGEVVPLVLPDRSGRTPPPGCEVSYEPWGAADVVELLGIRCARPARALFDLVRSLGVEDAVVAVDMAAAARVASPVRLAAYAGDRSRWRRAGRVDEVLRYASEHSESPPEARLRCWSVRELGWSLLVNPAILAGPRFLARTDLLDEGAGLVIEFDGAHHFSGAHRSKDAGREELLRGVGLEYACVTGWDLHHRDELRARLESVRLRALGWARTRAYEVQTQPLGQLDDYLSAREALSDQTWQRLGVRTPAW